MSLVTRVHLRNTTVRQVSRVKIVPLVAGATRHHCFFLDMGDALAARPDRLYEPHLPHFMHPDLQKSRGSPAEILTSYVRALRPFSEGGSKDLQQVVGKMVPPVPAKATAAGVRAGACNTLLSNMPDGLAVHMTGHLFDGRKVCAVWDYIDSSRANCMPGCVVLAGYPAFAWGQRGKGPVAATLEALTVKGVPAEVLEAMMDTLFRIDNSVAPVLHQGGKLRPALRCSFATLIMYYGQRLHAGEMNIVLFAMDSAYRTHAMPQLECMQGEARYTFLAWGEEIRSRFMVDNLHLNGKESGSGTERIVETVVQLGQTFAGDTLPLLIRLRDDLSICRTPLSKVNRVHSVDTCFCPPAGHPCPRTLVST